jgi:hypothetical protein
MSAATAMTLEERFAAMRARQLALVPTPTSKSQRSLTTPRVSTIADNLPPPRLFVVGRPKRAAAFEWTRSETLALALHCCAHCRGTGLTLMRGGVREGPCNCVLRAIFRACLNKYHELGEHQGYMSRVSWDVTAGGGRKGSYGLKVEEFRADFELVAKRTLIDELEFRLFRYHFLLGADWRLCCARVGLDRGNFFHACYRIEQKLGRVFRELRPHALFPLDEYFSAAPLMNLAGAIKPRWRPAA